MRFVAVAAAAAAAAVAVLAVSANARGDSDGASDSSLQPSSADGAFDTGATLSAEYDAASTGATVSDEAADATASTGASDADDVAEQQQQQQQLAEATATTGATGATGSAAFAATGSAAERVFSKGAEVTAPPAVADALRDGMVPSEGHSFVKFLLRLDGVSPDAVSARWTEVQQAMATVYESDYDVEPDLVGLIGVYTLTATGAIVPYSPESSSLLQISSRASLRARQSPERCIAAVRLVTDEDDAVELSSAVVSSVADGTLESALLANGLVGVPTMFSDPFVVMNAEALAEMDQAQAEAEEKRREAEAEKQHELADMASEKAELEQEQTEEKEELETEHAEEKKELHEDHSEDKHDLEEDHAERVEDMQEQ